MVLIYTLGGEPLLRAVFGDDLTEASGALPWLGLAMALLACAYLSVQYLLALHHRRFIGVLGDRGRGGGGPADRRRRQPHPHRYGAGRAPARVRGLHGHPGPANSADTLSREAALREDALSAVRRYAEEALATREFVPGETTVPVAGRVIGAPELEALVDASLDGWLTEGRFAARFAPAFAQAAGRDHALLVGSGSQANLLAVAGRVLAAARAPASARRRGGHARPRLRHDRGADLPERPRAGLRGRGARHAEPVARGVRGRHHGAHARRGGRPLPREPVRRRRTRRALRRARARADRGLLRRPRLDARRAARSGASDRRPRTRSIRRTT